MTDPITGIGEICFQVFKATSMVGIRETLRAAAAGFGATFFALTVRTPGAREPTPFVVSNYPSAWWSHYTETKASDFDPVIHKALQFGDPFQWQGLFQSPREQLLRNELARHGIAHGMTASNRAADGSTAILCFCGPGPLAPDPKRWERVSAALLLLTSTVHRSIQQITNPEHRDKRLAERRALTKSERRCVELIAIGKTADATAKILGVKPRTVRYYLDRVAEKLGASTRKQAVTLAITHRLIATSDVQLASTSPP